MALAFISSDILLALVLWCAAFALLATLAITTVSACASQLSLSRMLLFALTGGLLLLAPLARRPMKPLCS